MEQITISGGIYNIHPIYDSYASNEGGHIIDINKKATVHGQCHNGYLYMNFKIMSHRLQYSFHRFVWECFNDDVPEGSVIKHINNNERDNRISNLRLVSKKVPENDVIEDFVIELEDEIVIEI